LRLRIPSFAPVQASGATTGAFPLLRPTSATVALDCGRARSLKEELAPPCAGLFFRPRRCFIGCKKSPALWRAGLADQFFFVEVSRRSSLTKHSRRTSRRSSLAKQMREAGDGSRCLDMALSWARRRFSTQEVERRKKPRVSGAEYSEERRTTALRDDLQMGE
jgi:hypothetical protein